MNKELLLNDISNILEIDLSNLNDNLELYSLSNWDSLVVISMIGAIDRHCKLTTNENELMSCKKLGDIFDLIEDKITSISQQNDSEWQKNTSTLMKAVGEGRDKILGVFLKRGFNLNEGDAFGRTPLYIAVYANQYACAELLLSHGADVNRASIYGVTPLDCALRENNIHMIRLLLSYMPHIDNDQKKKFHSEEILKLMKQALEFQNYIKSSENWKKRVEKTLKSYKPFYAEIDEEDINQLKKLENQQILNYVYLYKQKNSLVNIT